ncbi:MAG TPA: PLDc N-terminal domain-containing protein [Sphingobacteriaceae bacterium]|nr:PLDc N-terminal domain-containing protein [Sphingobacteriaceae bacterium]
MNLTLILFIGGLFRFIFGVIWLILVVVAIMDLLKSSVPMNTKLLWLIVILLAPVFGSLIYLFWGRHHRI